MRVSLIEKRSTSRADKTTPEDRAAGSLQAIRWYSDAGDLIRQLKGP